MDPISARVGRDVRPQRARLRGGAARAFLRSAGTAGSATAGAISSVTTSPASAPAALARRLLVRFHFEPVAFLAVWLELGLKRNAIDGAFDWPSCPPRGELRTGVLWQGEKCPGVGLLALSRPEEFRFETGFLEAVFSSFAWYH